MIADNINLDNIIPQRAPFAMIDGLLEHSSKGATSSLQVLSSNILVENDKLSAAGMLENMAQTAAAHLGYEAFIRGLDAPIGFIAAVKNFNIINQPAVGDQVKTKIEYTNTILNIHIVNAVSYLNDEKSAEAELRIFIQE